MFHFKRYNCNYCFTVIYMRMEKVGRKILFIVLHSLMYSLLATNTTIRCIHELDNLF